MTKPECNCGACHVCGIWCAANGLPIPNRPKAVAVVEVVKVETDKVEKSKKPETPNLFEDAI